MISKQEKLQTDLWREEGPWLLLLVLPLLSLAFRRGVLLSLLLLPCVVSPEGAQAMGWKDVWQTPDQQGQALMQQKKPAAAAGLFERSDWKAASLYRAKKYKQAADALKAPGSADGWYNRGNALAKGGDLKAALDAYERALELAKANGTDGTNKTYDDAQFNRDLVNKAMQQSQQKQADQKESDQKKSDKENKSDKQNKGDQKKNTQDKNKQGQKGDKSKDQDKSGSQQGKSQQTDQKNSDQKNSEQKQPDQKRSDQKQPDQQKQDVQKKDQQEQQAQAKGQDKGEQKKQVDRASGKAGEQKDKEASAALQQWLRRIPDDPGGLLRRKFRYQYQQQNQSNGAGVEQW